MKVSDLEGAACWLSTTRKEVGYPLDCCCCPLVATWLCLVGWMTWFEGICDSGMVKVSLQLALAAMSVEMSVAQMLKMHLSFMKVYVAVAAGADNHTLRPYFECC